MPSLPIQLDVDGEFIRGDLNHPAGAHGLVIFAHGSGSSRLSPRNRQVAAALNQAGLATLLLDLLTAREDEQDELSREWRFNIPLLASRLCLASDWLDRDPEWRDLPRGLFGASTGAAAALIAAARRPQRIAAVVSRGGRPDLAGADLAGVLAPTLLIVGGRDPEVLALNQAARAEMRAPCRIAIVPGATHLFEEPGCLQQVISLASGFFAEHLRTAVSTASGRR
jgi:putative phosphoribosyl transferase